MITLIGSTAPLVATELLRFESTIRYFGNQDYRKEEGYYERPCEITPLESIYVLSICMYVM